jgi:hypothetical protein
MARAGFARGFGLLDFAVLDFDFVGADLAGIGIP